MGEVRWLEGGEVTVREGEVGGGGRTESERGVKLSRSSAERLAAKGWLGPIGEGNFSAPYVVDHGNQCQGTEE